MMLIYNTRSSTFLQMMEEIFLHLSGTNSALPAMVQILADFASSDGIPVYLFVFTLITSKGLESQDLMSDIFSLFFW